jgi:hypothetical protein
MALRCHTANLIGAVHALDLTATGVTSRGLQPALDMARTLPQEQLPAFLGALEEVRVTAFTRLTAISPAHKPEELVGIAEASRRLGISKSYLYRNSGKFNFVSHIGRKLVFSSVGIDRYITARR